MNKIRITTIVAVSVCLSNLALGMYCPESGRFLQQDPIGTAPQVTHTQQGPKVINTQIAAANISPNAEDASEVDNEGQESYTQYVDGMSLYQYVKSNPILYTDAYGLSARPTFFSPPPKNCGVLVLYAGYPSNEGKERKRGIMKSGNVKYAYSIENFDLASVMRNMSRNCCNCFKSIMIKDHGTAGYNSGSSVYVGMQGYGYMNSGGTRFFNSMDMWSLCFLLCPKATITMAGCNVGNGSRRGFDPIFSVCGKLSKIKACTGTVSRTTEKCNGRWRTFHR